MTYEKRSVCKQAYGGDRCVYRQVYEGRAVCMLQIERALNGEMCVSRLKAHEGRGEYAACGGLESAYE